ncbi:hypothetical protein E2C01_090130 [Portunus trituberculatus]|uniref:Uncharacterized protein n=1 Tax=Portunus trituberculatus TaxID=210409 RepID=A0A5B7JPC0_PORTR|nr:hypothetical protein [Portunus trituberculatus]
MTPLSPPKKDLSTLQMKLRKITTKLMKTSNTTTNTASSHSCALKTTVPMLNLEEHQSWSSGSLSTVLLWLCKGDRDL